MPSIVVISDSVGTRFIVVVHERTTLPLRITEHEPHWPWPQATLVPVSPACRRITSDSFSFASHMTTVGSPLMMSSFLSMHDSLERMAGRWRVGAGGLSPLRGPAASAARLRPDRGRSAACREGSSERRELACDGGDEGMPVLPSSGGRPRVSVRKAKERRARNARALPALLSTLGDTAVSRCTLPAQAP